MTMIFDLHIHTSRYSPDSFIDPFDLVRRAQELGLDGIVITEHDRIWPEHELEELRAAAPGLVVLSGVEVSARQGHVLVYGITDEDAVPVGINWADLCREVRRLGGAAVAAHPNRFGQNFDAELRSTRAELHGIEMMSKNMDAHLRGRAEQILQAHPEYATLGNSDAHELYQIGMCVTDFAVEIRSNADLVAAITSRQATARPRG